MNAPVGPVTATDLDVYCARIGYDGPLTPTLDTLKAIQGLHPATIVFENMDVLLGRAIELAPAALADKLIANRRGGYCFEQNTLFRHVLASIGFRVESLIARVWWAVPQGSAYARTHMALRVTIDGVPWLCDVGFGGCVPTAPLRMDTPEAQPTAHEDFRMVPSEDGLMLQARRGGAWLKLYEMQERPQRDEDLEMMNWYTATFPDSLFRRNLMAARTTPQARYGLRNAQLTIRKADGAVEQHALDAEQIEQALAEIFELPVTPEWRPILRKVADGTL
jgi:N-hydroxyarylamine O-acetyltransferase